jgi:uncharacterized protein (TIGR00299 family) protein
VIGWLDCGSGASGDMLLGALVGAGVPLEVLDAAVGQVAPERVTLRTEAVQRAGLAATRVHVAAPESHVHRTMGDVRDLLLGADLAADVRARSLEVFERLATAEGAVHGIPADDVHFHEVGALDAIADVVGVCTGLVHLGLDRLVCSTVGVGSGTVRAAHGLLPVPPPAVVELLRGWASAAGPAERELCTPTGAALLTSWATGQGPQPAMVVDRVGIGAGGADLPSHPNVVRLLVGEPVQASGPGVAQLLLEANVDDLDPRLWPALLERLLATGAVDAWLTPILMKKGRPAHTLSVLADPSAREDLLDVVFAESSTIGVREHTVSKLALVRETTTVDVDGRPVRVKIARRRGRVVNVQPEYDDVALAASVTGVPLKVVLARAAAAGAAHLGTPAPPDPPLP